MDSCGRPGANELYDLVRREAFGEKVFFDMDGADQDRAAKREAINNDIATVRDAFKRYEAATGVDPATLSREQQREIALGGLNALDQGALLDRTWEQLADLYMQIDKAAFRYPFSQSKEFGDILNDMLPGAQAGDWMDAPKALRDKGIQAVLHVLMKDGRRARLDLHPGNRISLDASNLKSGESYGGALYQAIADYALKNGLVFMGDPQGLSDIAVHRRTEQMLSAALRAKTTRHLAPHARQGVRWEVGNDRANIAALLEKSHENVAEIVPEIADWRYNFSHGRFEPVAEKSNAKWGAWVRRASRSEGAREAGIGRTTLERAVLAQSLLQGEGRAAGVGVVAPHAQRGDPEQLNPLAGALHGTDLEGILYQDNPAAGGVSDSGDGLPQGGKSPRGQIVGRDGQSIIGQKAENGSREFNITLFEGKDLSTVLHEAGHAFFEIFGDLAGDANASERLKADYKALLDWTGVKDRSEVGRTPVFRHRLATWHCAKKSTPRPACADLGVVHRHRNQRQERT